MIKSGYRRKIVEYFKKNLLKGYTEESLKWMLMSQGYTRTDIGAAVAVAKKELSEKEKTAEKEKPEIKYEIYDADNKPLPLNYKKPFWKRILRI